MKLEEDFRNLDEPSIDYQVQGWRSWRRVEHRGGEDHSKTDQDLYFSFKFLRSNQIKSGGDHEKTDPDDDHPGLVCQAGDGASKECSWGEPSRQHDATDGELADEARLP